ncbi:MAG TPA: SH3 domain-containing protein [Caulobacteraceae bacterium]|nr:SH3 domain-containing protein [Caulobacteraceae bacterium]
MAAAPIVAALIGALGLSGCGDRGGEGKDCPAAQAKTPSGFCVPRYVSLKRGEVYARKGPGKDYETLFVYHAQGLPVQVVQETTDWRRICDPDGALVWVHRSMVDGRRTVIATGAEPTPIRRFAKPTAPLAATLNVRALASLDHCRGDWCKVSVGGVSGWVARGDVWGTREGVQCRTPAAAPPAPATQEN